jgi:lipopolysaccharide transport system permease protein
LNSNKQSAAVPADPVTVYEASGRDRVSLGAWRLMVSELWEYRELVQRLVLKGFTAQLRQSFLGYLWVVLPPVATTLVFVLLRGSGIMQVPTPDGAMPYTLFVLVNTTLWGLFSQVTIMATTSVFNAGSLVTKIYFPREILVLSASGNGIINFAVRLLVVAVMCVLLGYVPHWQIVFLPIVLLPFLAFAIGLGLFFAPINTMMNDMGRALEFGFQFGMLLAPTVYPTPNLAANGDWWQTALYWLHTLNPVSHYMYVIDDLMQTGSIHLTPGFQVSAILSFLIFFAGWRFFHACEPLLAERM